MDKEFTYQEINWHYKSIYTDIETGEIITKKQYNEHYIKIKTNTLKEIQRQTGYVTYTIECRRTTQLSLFGNNNQEAD